MFLKILDKVSEFCTELENAKRFEFSIVMTYLTNLDESERERIKKGMCVNTSLTQSEEEQYDEILLEQGRERDFDRKVKK